MARLDIYDKLGRLLESHDVSNLQKFLEGVKGYDPSATVFSCKKNNRPWSSFCDDLNKDDVVGLTIEPKDPVSIFLAVVAVASAAYSYYQYQKIKDQYQKTRADGQSIYAANARANTPKPNGVIPEVAGKATVYPDLICPVVKRFDNHQEYIYLMMCVSSGYMAIKESNIYIDQTPLTNYAGDYTLNIYEPGDDVTGNVSHENWYTSREVSDLKLETKQEIQSGQWSLGYSGATMTSYLDGVETQFPFNAGSTFIVSGGSYPGRYGVVSIGSPNSVATVQSLAVSNNVNTIATRANSLASAQAARSRRGRSNYRYIPIVTGSSTPSFTPVSPVENVSIESINGGINWEGPFQIIPDGETARYVEFDVSFPGGLVFLDDDGDEQSATVSIDVQYRAVGSSTWNVVGATTYTDNTFDERGYTVSVDMGSSIRPEFRFRRVTKDSDDVSLVNDVYIRSIRAKLETPTSYDGVTTMALIMRGTNAIADSAENKVNIKGASRKLPTLQEIENAANGTPYNISSSVTRTSGNYLFNNDAVLSSAVEAPSGDIRFSDDGTRFALMTDGNLIESYSLNEPFSLIDGYTLGSSFAFGGASGRNGNTMFLNGGNYVLSLTYLSSPSLLSVVYLDYMSTPYDLSTIDRSASPNLCSSFFASGGRTRGSVVYMSENGQKMWLLSDGGLSQYSLSTAFNLNTASIDDLGSPSYFDMSAEFTSVSPNIDFASGFWMGDNSGGLPTKLWVTANSSGINPQGYFFEYVMSSAGDLSTATINRTVVTEIHPFQITSDFAFNQIATSVNKSPSESINEVEKYVLSEADDSRASRSLIRFSANSIYDAIGAEAASSVDWDRMSELDTLLESRQDYFDADFSDETTLWEAQKTILTVGFCEPAMKSGKFHPSRLVAGTGYDHIYTPEFMLGDGLTVDDEHYDGLDADGVDVEYLDVDTGEVNVVECRLSGDQGVRPKKIKIIGADRTRAWRIGMRARLEIRHKPANYTFRTEMDALNSEYLDPIAVCSDIFNAQCGSVIGVSGNTITLDFSPVLGSGQYYAAFKKPNGRMSGLYTISGGSPSNTILITSSPSLDFVPITDMANRELTTVSIGLADDWGRRAICRKISPRGDSEVSVIAQEYVPQIFAYDDSEPS